MANSINATSTSNGGLITTGDDSGVLNIQTNETTAISIDASQNATFTNGANLPNTFGFKNRIINGNMAIDQRNAGAAVTVTNVSDILYPVDRFGSIQRTDGQYTVQQVTDAPTGFLKSIKTTITTADTSLTSLQWAMNYQTIEGFNISDLAWGTASAASVTLSFWVKSSLTGTFSGSFRNSANDRSYPFTYAISSANTWEQKTVTILGDTSGTWLTDNNSGIKLNFSLGCGTGYQSAAGAWAAGDYRAATGETPVIGTVSATLYITGVQLEKGTQATSFDFRSYGTELALCQRYYYKITAPYSVYTNFGQGTSYTSTSVRITVPLPVTMRTTPQTLDASAASLFLVEQQAGATFVASAVTSPGNQSPTSGFVAFAISGGTAGLLYAVYANNSNNAYLGFGAEL